MGIDPHHAIMLIREHAYKPLPETVHLIGRQTVRLTHAQAVKLFHDAGIEPVRTDVRIDNETRLAQSSGTDQYITDHTFFQMFGVKKIVIIDHSDYEGANLILDLNRAIPDHHKETADFIFGGSVCDNVFDPAMYIRNMAGLLKPHGRLTDQNIVTDHFHPYAILPPAWYFDFFVVNKFDDCKVYVLECTPPAVYVYGVETTEETKNIWNFTGRDTATANGIFLIAEKGVDSTTEMSPIQDQYRSSAHWAEYRDALRRISQSSRPMFSFIIDENDTRHDYPPRRIAGYRFVGKLW